MRNQPLGAVVYGIDLGKTRFDVVGCEMQQGFRSSVRSSYVMPFFTAVPKALIGMEACPGRAVDGTKAEPARPHGPDHSSTIREAICEVEHDARDAEAIHKQSADPQCEQIDLQALHRACAIAS
jgi:transposase